jgi:hypothetical protein
LTRVRAGGVDFIIVGGAAAGPRELIAIKSKTGRSRDQMVVPILLALLRRGAD